MLVSRLKTGSFSIRKQKSFRVETHYIMIQRNLIYTGITRGRRLVVLVGTKKALAMAIWNNKTGKRS